MVYTKSVYLKSKELPLLSFLEIFSAGAQFLTHAVVAVYTAVYLCSGINRQMHSFAECTHCADMICVVMGN